MPPAVAAAPAAWRNYVLLRAVAFTLLQTLVLGHGVLRRRPFHLALLLLRLLALAPWP